jgi:putative DNA methylase
MGQKLMAIVAKGTRGRVYLTPTAAIEAIAAQAKPTWKPEMALPNNPRDFKTPNYGLTTYGDIFTKRQLVALTTFSDLVAEARQRVIEDFQSLGKPTAQLSKQWEIDDTRTLDQDGSGPRAYADAVSVYLAFALDKMADLGNSLCRWENIAQCPRQLFGKQAIPMIWDFAEANPLGDSSGSWEVFVDGLSKAHAKVFDQTQSWFRGAVVQADAQRQIVSKGKFVSSDPPYYDNIGYAELSDFFYIWLRRTLRPVYPELFSTIAVPKTEELVATPYRHGGKEEAETFFLNGMTKAMRGLADQAHPAAPITIYYAFKQSETSDTEGTISAGWVSFLGAVCQAGLLLSGTWPLRTENASRMIGQGKNALASSIVLVCRKRPTDAPSISRREFIRELNGVLPEALDEMTKGSGDERSPVAPVDLSQAIIGPGMAVFSKYAAVLEADGSPMSVRTALQLINRFLAEDDFDADTQFCLHWFEQHGWNEGAFGTADTLARGKGTAVDGIRDAGVIQSGGGKVRLLKWPEYPTDWDPRTDTRTPVWEALHQLIRALKQGGDSASGALLAALGGKAEAIRQLAYRLYTLCERLGKAEDARAYNDLITSWTGIESAANSVPKPADPQGTLFER